MFISSEQRILAFVNKVMTKICKLLNNSYHEAVEILQGHMKPVRLFDSLHNKRKQKSADLLRFTPNLHSITFVYCTPTFTRQFT